MQLNKYKCEILLTLCLLLAPRAIFAADAEGEFTVLSMGTQSCSSYQQAFRSGGWNKLLYSVWIGGYLTAVNEYLSLGANVATRMDAEERDQWVFEYCTSNPDDTVQNEASSLLRELSDNQDTR